MAIVSDIHGNRTALEAIVADLRVTSPDLTLHGGDLADGGSSPVEVVDRIRDLGWPGVVGNTDEMLFQPETFTAFAAQSPQLQALWIVVGEMAGAARQALGPERLEWLRNLPHRHTTERMALVHATPGSRWRAPGQHAPDDELDAAYRSLGRAVVVYGHIHRPFVRTLDGLTVANSGSAGLPADGDPRASYLLLDGNTPQVRRVEYDVEAECRLLNDCGMPHAEWVIRTLRAASMQMP